VILEYFLADILALCTGMRPTVMVDYGGKMPELQERLCQLMKLIQKVFTLYYLFRFVGTFCFRFGHCLM
jgi:hypothetical protein